MIVEQDQPLLSAEAARAIERLEFSPAKDEPSNHALGRTARRTSDAVRRRNNSNPRIHLPLVFQEIA